MRRLAIYATCLTLVLALPFGALAQQSERRADDKRADKPAKGDERFLKKAAESNLAEVQLGKLAAERASSSDVKNFGQRMATDHQKAYDELQKLAQAKGFTLPTEVDRGTKKELDRLSKLTGAEFDRAYMRLMARDHDKDVKEFEKAAKSAKDPEVRDWAGKTLPTLQEHQRIAHDLDAQVRSASRGSRSPSASPSSTPPPAR